MAVNKVNTWRVERDNEEDYLNIDCEDTNSVYRFGHRALYKDFVEALEEDREPLISGVAGMNTVKIILTAYKSQMTGLPVKFDEFKSIDIKSINLRG